MKKVNQPARSHLTRTIRPARNHPNYTHPTRSSKKSTPPVLARAKRDLRLVMSESALTAGLMAISVFTPFYNSIGLNNEEIALTQIIFTIATLLLNIPLGYIADRFSRKWANVIGDFGHGLAMLFYSAVNGFTGAVICEIMAGVMSALSDGVDQSLIKHFTSKIANTTGESETHILKTKTAKVERYKYFVNLCLLLLGGPIGAIDLRLAIALSSINHFAGGIVSLFIKDDSEKLRPQHKNPIKDMFAIARTALGTESLRWRIFAYAVGRELTHGIIWIATPLFLQAGVPMWLVSLVWGINSLAAMFGARLAQSFGHKLIDWQLLAVPVVLMVFSMGTMGVCLNLVTVWFYCLMGIAQGWSGATLTPMVQKQAKPSEQTSILSLTKVAGQLLYIPAVWIIGTVADIRLEYGLFATILIFLPLGIIVMKKLKRV
ncbi:hypothetical protein J5500_01385 [Candidatus Saccharibacteria bacterium]|nr:hypothetical protein [Candidatus Saccharibacteria bacterium]